MKRVTALVLAIGVGAGAAIGLGRYVVAACLVGAVVLVGVMGEVDRRRTLVIVRRSGGGRLAVPAATGPVLFRGPVCGALLLVAGAISVGSRSSVFTGGGRYLLAAAAVVPLAIAALGHRQRVSRSVAVFTLGWAIGMGGSIWALRSGAGNTWLQIFATMTVAVVVAHSSLGGRLGLHAAVSLLATCSAIVTISGALLWLGGLRELSAVSNLNHELAFVHAAAILGSLSLGRRRIALLSAGATVVGFVAYPAATYVLVALVSLLIYSGFRGSRLRRRLSWLLVAGVVVFTVNAVRGDTNLSGDYAERVGKGDNSDFRRELWDTGLEDVRASPWVGEWFANSYSIDYRLGMQPTVVPVHNEYISLMRGGGILGLLMVAGPMLLALGRRPPRAIEVRNQVNALRVTVAGFMVAGLANPVWSRPSTSIFGWFALGVLMASRERDHSVDAPAGPAPIPVALPRSRPVLPHDSAR